MRFVHDIADPRVVFGAGSPQQVALEAARLGGDRVLLVVGAHSAAARSVLESDLGARLACDPVAILEGTP
jgi:hypothetical protein